MIILIILFTLTYLAGAIPTGYWVGLANGVDLTKEGSKSTGATNVLRCVGKWQAALVMLIDILKGFAPVYFIKNYLPLDPWLIVLLAFLPIIGHSKSIFIGFKGGKSSATGFGIILALNWIVAIITIALWFTTVKVTRTSSLGSIVAVPLVPVWFWVFGESLPVILFGVAAFIYIVLIKHRSNIRRLLSGTEAKF